MRRRSATSSVSLFPFLAVLICAMGALILLLIILTRQIREQAFAELAASAASNVPAEPLPAPVLPTPVVEPEPPATIPQVVITVVPPAPPAPPDPNPALRDRLARLTAEQQTALQQTERARLDVTRRQAELQSAEASLAAMQADVDAARQQVEARESQRIDFQADRSRLLAAVSRSRDALTAAKQAAATAAPEVSILPYDGRSGTARRPILIECTGSAIRFLPEGVELKAGDLEGFLPDYNPLLAGAVALREYWKLKDETGNDRPYVLLIVREDGIAAYYAARTLLRSLGAETGYELVTDDMKIALPKVDPDAQELCRHAVAELLDMQPELASAVQKHGVEETLFPTGRFEVDPQKHDPTRSDDNEIRDRIFQPRSPIGALPQSRPPAGVPRQVARSDPRPPVMPLPASGGGSPAGSLARSFAERAPGEDVPAEDALDIHRSLPERPFDVAALERAESSSWPSFQPAGSGKQKWGTCAPTANISLERPIAIEVTSRQITVGSQPPIAIDGAGITQQTVRQVFDAIRGEANAWGRAPGQFYWSPKLNATVRPGGTRHFDRLRESLAVAGLRASSRIELEPVSSPFAELQHVSTAP